MNESLGGWEENIIGKRGYSQMIYYTNIGTMHPIKLLVFSAEDDDWHFLVFVQKIRPGDVFLLGGSPIVFTEFKRVGQCDSSDGVSTYGPIMVR
ncbi:MAG: hypothetical protein Ct9H90mP16_20910 [Candidatus Poseidoniales archaeon]|nr:MAG: hypothetical protein Ct9H90mP16_20910 [Candidatus Poseidoniales archaeon]